MVKDKRFVSQDTCHAVLVFNSEAQPAFELLLYSLTDRDMYTCPNEYVSIALNRRGFKPGEVSVSPFFVERIR